MSKKRPPKKPPKPKKTPPTPKAPKENVKIGPLDPPIGGEPVGGDDIKV